MKILDLCCWRAISCLVSSSRSWLQAVQTWHGTPHVPSTMAFQASGDQWEFSCQISCEELVPGQHQEVSMRFHGLSARETPEFRWVWQVGNTNFEESEDAWWWTDDEYPYAAGMYLSGYTNQPDFFKKLKLPETVVHAASHKVTLSFDELCGEDGDFGYSGAPIGVVLDDTVRLDTGPGLGMKGAGKGSIKLCRPVPRYSKKVRVSIEAMGPVKVCKEAGSR